MVHMWVKCEWSMLHLSPRALEIRLTETLGIVIQISRARGRRPR